MAVYVHKRTHMKGENMGNEGRVIGNVVSMETGEIIDEVREGDKILRDKSSEYLDSTKEWDMKVFYKGNSAELRLLMKDLSIYEKSFLFSVAPYVDFTDCHLSYRNGVDIGSEDLVRITGMGRRQVYEIIGELIKKDILYKGKNSKNRQYFVNPWLFCKGNRINKVLKTMFKNYKIRVLNGVKWKDLYE